MKEFRTRRGLGIQLPPDSLVETFVYNPVRSDADAVRIGLVHRGRL